MKILYSVCIPVMALLVISGCTKNNQSEIKDRLSALASGMSSVKAKAQGIKAGDIKKADKGYTIEECYAKKQELSGKTVDVRGKVVSFNAGIMNRNWIHIQDGTGGDSSYDLTVTSSSGTGLGKIVLVRGVIAYDKSFGQNLNYPVIIENAAIIEEK